MQRMSRFAMVIATSMLLSGCFGGKMPKLPSNDHLPVAHPRDVAAKVAALVSQIEEGLSSATTRRGPKSDVNPVPCGVEGLRREVKRTEPLGANPYMNPWYVSFSPYSMGMVSSVDIPRSVDMDSVFPRLRSHLHSSGWRIDKYEQHARGFWDMRAESPEKGYGGLIDGPQAGSRRIVVSFSSPCFRHPDEISKR